VSGLHTEPTPARRLAFTVLRRTFEDGAFTDRAFRADAERAELEGRERAQAQHLAYGAVQRRGTADALVERFSGREIADLDPPVAAALRLGIYELLFADATPDHAAVDESVELVKRSGAARAQGFVNALLRRCARERGQILAGLSDADPGAAALAHSAPQWLTQMWWDQLGPGVARSLLRAANEPVETAMRVNTLRANPQEVLRELAASEPGDGSSRSGAAEVSARATTGGSLLEAAPLLVFAGGVGDAAGRLIADGVLTPQSRGSAAVVEVLDPRPGQRILDLCAGPGIKATQVAERIGDESEVVAVEIDHGRRREIDEGAKRLGLGCVRTVQGDAVTAEMGEGYDRVLLDAPCSDLGALSSRPDARWRKSPAQIEELAEIQAALLRRAVGAVAPGGALVYATCTISRLENGDQIAALMADPVAAEMSLDDLGKEHPGLAAPDDPRCLALRPDRDETTGFFIARLTRA